MQSSAQAGMQLIGRQKEVHPLMKMMYLEISPRRSGKTTRLVKAIVRHLQDSNTVILHCGYHEHARSIFRQIVDRLKDPSKHENIFVINNKSELDKLRGRRFQGYPRVFCDEAQAIRPENLIQDYQGYYVYDSCCNLTWTRNEWALKITGNQYWTYIHPGPVDDLYELRKNQQISRINTSGS